MKRLSIVLVIFMMLFVWNCGKEETPNAEREQQKKTNQLLNEVNRQIGMPNIKNFQQKKLMKMIFELCDMERLECYLYLWSPYLAKFVYIKKCIGYGIPFSAQYTSPMKGEDIVRGSTGSKYVPMPQADPNMLYMPTSSSATWIIMLVDGNIKVGYFEPEIVVLPFVMDNRIVVNHEMNGK